MTRLALILPVLLLTLLADISQIYPQFVANSSHTPPPMEEILLCGHPTALI